MNQLVQTKTCLITGASGGIGLATALDLARRGWRVRIVGRNAAKLAATTATLQRVRADVTAFRADFSSLAEVRSLAAQLLARDEPLHVLINNAGVWHPEFTLSRDGFEDTFAVNHLASFLLTQLLLPRMRETEGDRRVVHVSSRLHVQAGLMRTLSERAVHFANVIGVPVVGRAGAHLDFDALERRNGYRGIDAYARSKLAQVVYSCELARRERDVTSNAVHPGSVHTDVTRDNRVLAAFAPLARHVLKTPAQGARTSVYVAQDDAVRGVTGGYFANARAAVPASAVHDRDCAARLWALSCERVGSTG